MKFALLSLAVAAVIGSACAQSSGLPACAISCLVMSFPGSGCQQADISCLCKNPAFLSSVMACLQSNCTADDIAAVLALEEKTCGSTSK